MAIDTMSIVIFVIAWGVPSLMIVRGYLKMNADDKKAAINEFKSRKFILTFGFIIIVFFFLHIGTLFTVSLIGITGVILIILGGIFSASTTWKNSKIKSILILVLVLLMIYINW